MTWTVATRVGRAMLRRITPLLMGNPISPELTLGTIAELLVQASLLQYDVQAAPPLKDSGNDLIAIRGAAIRAIQIKATRSSRYGAPQARKRYDILAAVRMRGNDRRIYFDHCDIFLLEKHQLPDLPRSFDALAEEYRLSEDRVNALFPRRG